MKAKSFVHIGGGGGNIATPTMPSGGSLLLALPSALQAMKPPTSSSAPSSPSNSAGRNNLSSAASTKNAQNTFINTGLGNDVDLLASKSPSLQKDLKSLQDNGWKILYGANGGGSFADRDATPKVITIDGNLKSNPAAATQTLAHEVGHATYPYKADYSSKSAYVDGALADEGAATLNNIKVQREILANGGPDIGIAGNPANHTDYNNAYNAYLSDGNAASARQAIGNIFGKGEITSTSGQPYSDYYGGWYDANFHATK